MKPFHTFIGLLIFGLLAQHGLGDISLTLRNRARSNRRRQAYLPPPVQDVTVKNDRNNEEYYNVHEEHPQKFEESNYGNSRYQIFEVHNHYEPQQPQQQQPHSPTQSNFEAKGYLPPHQEIRIQHVNQAQDANDDHLDVSFLSFAAGDSADGQQITIAEHAPSAAPPTPTVPVPFPSNYQHDFQKSSSGEKELEEAIFQAAGYLPPSEGQAPGTPQILVKHIDGQTGQEIRQSNYRAPDYLPPQGPEHAAKPQNAPEYRAPDYLPPHREQQGQRQQYQQQQQQQQPPAHHQQQETHHAGTGAQQQYQQRPQTGNAGHGGRFKGSDYLPPHKSGFMASPVRGVVREQHAHPQSRPTAHAKVQQAAFRKPGYSQPYTEEHQHVEHHNVQGQQQQSYQQHHHSQNQIQTGQTQSTFKGPDYLPPHNAGNTQQQQVPQANYKGPDYLPPHQEAPQQQHQQVSQSNYKGPDYLPPHQEAPQQQQHFNSVQQQDTTSGSFAQQQVHQTNYKGPDYLPPHQDAQQQQQFQQQQQSVAPGQTDSYKGPDYLPPHADTGVSHHQSHNEQHFESETSSTGSSNEYRSPGYLPPGYDFANPEEQPQEQPQQQQQHHEEAPISYPQQHPLPQPAPQHEIPQTAPIQTPYHAPEYLPPGYEFNKPEGAEQAIAQLHSQQPQVQPQAAPQYHQHQQTQVSQHHHHHQQQQQQQHQQVVVQAQIQVAGREQASDIIYGTHGHHSTAEAPSSFQGDGYLPPHADSPAAPISPVQSQANYQVQQGQVQTVASYNGGSSFGQQQAQQQIQQEYQQNTQQVAPQQFPQMPTFEGEPQYNAAPNNYPGPTAPSDFAQTEQQQSHMHSLSSYMTSVQPFERYGASQFTEPRRPFAEYGPPPTSAPHYQPQAQGQAQAAHQNFEVPSMYRGQTKRPQSYAPAMAYTSNAVTKAQTYTTYSAAAARHQQQSGSQYSTGLNDQAKQSLQKFMPKDIQQHIATAQVHAQVHVQPQVQAQIQVQAPQPPAAQSAPSVTHAGGAAPTSGKIRTVQIVNTNVVKTLKVLETSDHAGVRTIKILGHSNENPMGEHRIVKVVSQSPHNANENHVQTVKIYNDQKDVSIPATQATVASHNNGYLPPRAHATAKRAARVARQSLQQYQHKRHHSVTGRGRYRY